MLDQIRRAVFLLGHPQVFQKIPWGLCRSLASFVRLYLLTTGGKMKYNQRLKSAILQVVDNQIDSNDPPETKQTFNRLVSEGISNKEAKELIGTVVVAEIFDVLKEGKPFNIERYVNALNKLPETPA
jgi:hypothetical protein